jgi:hypothetical protein
VAIKVPRTRVVTLHRLWRTPADRDGLFDVLDLEQLDGLDNLDLSAVNLASHPGLWVEGTFRTRRFGLEFATRALDPKQIHKLLRRRPASRGRTEVTLMPSGPPIWAFDVADTYAHLVGRASGKSETIQLTHSNPQRPTPIDGGVGLQIRLATDPADLVADIQTIAGVLDLERRSELEFIDRIRPVQDDALLIALEPQLEAMLGASSTRSGTRSAALCPWNWQARPRTSRRTRCVSEWERE